MPLKNKKVYGKSFENMKSIQETEKQISLNKNDFNTIEQLFQQIKKSPSNTKNHEISRKIFKKFEKFMKNL